MSGCPDCPVCGQHAYEHAPGCSAIPRLVRVPRAVCPAWRVYVDGRVIGSVARMTTDRAGTFYLAVSPDGAALPRPDPRQIFRRDHAVNALVKSDRLRRRVVPKPSGGVPKDYR